MAPKRKEAAISNSPTFPASKSRDVKAGHFSIFSCIAGFVQTWCKGERSMYSLWALCQGGPASSEGWSKTWWHQASAHDLVRSSLKKGWQKIKASRAFSISNALFSLSAGSHRKKAWTPNCKSALLRTPWDNLFSPAAAMLQVRLVLWAKKPGSNGSMWWTKQNRGWIALRQCSALNVQALW